MKNFFKLFCLAMVSMVTLQAAAQKVTTLTPERRMLFNNWTGITIPARVQDYYITQSTGGAIDGWWEHVGPAAPGVVPPRATRFLLSGTNHIYRYVSGGKTNIWRMIGCRTGTAAQIVDTQTVAPTEYSASTLSNNWQANLMNALDARIETPFYPEGIGTVYFDAINVYAEYPGTLQVEIATNMLIYPGGWTTNIMMETEGGAILGDSVLSNNWQVLDSVELTVSNGVSQFYQRTLNHRHGARLRIRRTTIADTIAEGAYLAVDNICISRPPADVIITRHDVVFSPGYPASGHDAIIRCQVDNVGTNEYAFTQSGGAANKGRTLRAYYRWRYLDQASNDWASVTMTYVTGSGTNGNGEQYEGSIPIDRRAGDIEYYFVCEFQGERYEPLDFTQEGRTFWPEKQNPLGASEYSEWLSPRDLRGGASEPDGREFNVRLRPYPSDFGAVSVVTFPDSEENPIPMVLISNNVWRGMVPVNSGATNIQYYFKGERKYQQGLTEFSTQTEYWAESRQAIVGTVPYGGTCSNMLSRPQQRMQVNVTQHGMSAPGYVQFTLDLNDAIAPKYMTSRAEYQTFNNWPAPTDTFSDSNGQAQKQRYQNSFDAWPVNGAKINYEIFKEFFVGYSGSDTNVFVREPFETMNGWQAGSAAFVDERAQADENNRPTGTEDMGIRNLALRLKGGDPALGLGYVHNLARTLPDGIQKISFKARLGQTLNRFNAAYYKPGFTNMNYMVTARIKADDLMSPERPSVSMLGYYESPDRFYEFRVTQIPDTVDLTRDKRVRQEIYKWTNGVPTLLESKTDNTDDWLFQGIDSVVMRFYSTPTSTEIRCKWGGRTTLAYTDRTNPILRGSFGFLSSECRAGFMNVRLQATTTANADTGTGSVQTILTSTDTALFNTQIANWYVPAGFFEGLTSVNPFGIYACVPKQNIGVYLQKSEYQSGVAPASPGTTSWTLFDEIPLSGFEYNTYEMPIYNWRSCFVMLQAMGAANEAQQSIDIVVDELEVSAWRGQNSSDLSDGEDDDNNEIWPEEWCATEAWVTNIVVAGLSEGRLANRPDGSLQTEFRSPRSDVQLSTRLANASEGWVTNCTYVYDGEIYLSGTNEFAQNFDGSVWLKIGDKTLISTNAPAPDVIVAEEFNTGWHAFELRLSFRGDGSGGPADEAALQGLGIAYRKSGLQSWLALSDTGTASFLRTGDRQIWLDHTREGRQILNQLEGDWLGQGVRSPLLQNGVGLLEFDYRVVRPPAKLTVQFAPDWDATLWSDVKSLVVSNTMSEFAHMSAYLGTNVAGYIRVFNDRADGQYTNAAVMINNTVAWDEPTVDEASWRAYNVKITDTDPMRVMLDETKACFLNNSQTAETAPEQSLYEEAFVASPLLPTGLGSLSFMARVYTANESAPLYLYATRAAAGASAPDDAWEPLATFLVTNNQYETYSYAPSDGRGYRAFKFVTQTTVNSRRVCIEEVVASEPILPSFEIVNVIPICAEANDYDETRQQPLHSDQVGIQAQLSNFMLTPHNIELFVSYYVGTNHWGRENWPADETETLPMTLHDSLNYIYRTDYLAGNIPPQEKNSVVQYCVWAKYRDDDGTELETQQKEGSFVNPAWYYPINLNQTFASKGWTPYYIVYDIPVGGIWINEVNANDYSAISNYFGENIYLEIAVPAGFDMAGWQLDFVKSSYVSQTVVFTNGVPVLPPVTNGYAFFVIGDMNTSGIGTPPLTNVNYTVYQLSGGKLSRDAPGGIRLRRPMGMYEHCIVYDCYPHWGPDMEGQPFADSDPEQKLEFVGTEAIGGSLSVTNTPRYDVPAPSDWVSVLDWTPGLPNIGQNVPDANLMAPGVSNVVVISRMSRVLGSQNGLRVTPHSFKVKVGDSTNILYEADAWYRVTSVRVDGEERVSGEMQSFDLVLPNVQSNINIDVNFTLRSDINTLGLDSEVLTWLMGFGDAPLAPTWYGRDPYTPLSDRRELSITERYWINADPTVTNYLRGGVVDVKPDPGTSNYFVTVYLDLNGTKVTRLQGDNKNKDAVFKIEARQPPRINTWTTLSQFRFDESSFDDHHLSTIFIFNPFLHILTTGKPELPLTCRWVLEYEDPPLGKPILVSTNAPSATP